MLMKRRIPPTWTESLRVWIWPRRSWLRSGQYVAKRIMRLTATPHAIAAGVAAGAFASFTPFMGFHFIQAFIFAWLVRGNMIAAALGTFIGNPLTFPFIWAAAYHTGNFVLQTQDHGAEPPALGIAMKDVIEACWNLDGSAALVALGDIWFPILYPMLVGGIIVGLLVTIPIYFLTRRAAGIFRETRRNKLMAKATELRDRAKQMAERNDTSSKAGSA